MSAWIKTDDGRDLDDWTRERQQKAYLLAYCCGDVVKAEREWRYLTGRQLVRQLVQAGQITDWPGRVP